MTVADLIAQLSSLDPNLHVMVKGYEGGYDNVKTLGFREMRYAPQPFYGDYEPVYDDNVAYDVEDVISTVTLESF